MKFEVVSSRYMGKDDEDKTKTVVLEAETMGYEAVKGAGTILLFHDEEDELVAAFHDWDFARKIEDESPTYAD